MKNCMVIYRMLLEKWAEILRRAMPIGRQAQDDSGIVILDRKPSAQLALGASDRGSHRLFSRTLTEILRSPLCGSLRMTRMTARKGFTLIEMIVYVALTALIVSGAANVKWSIMKSNVSAQTHMEVSYNVRFSMNQIGRFIRNASRLEEGDSVFLTNPGVLVVTSADSGQKVTIDTFTKQVTIGGASVTIRKLRMKEGSGAYIDLTTDDVSVTNFYLEKIFRAGKIANINIQFAVENANPGGDPARNASMAVETSLSLRQ